MTARPSAAPRRHRLARLARLVRLAVVGLLVACLAGSTLVGPASAKPRGGGGKKGTTSVDAPWSGYRLAPTKKAAGGFLGARLVGADVVYRVDPDKRATTKGLLPTGTYVDTLTGSGKLAPSTEATARAAWVVAKYGSYKSKVQNAAVEVVLDELLVGGPWAVKGKKTKARLAQLKAGTRKKVLAQVGQMLTGATTYASAYRVSLSTTPSVLTGGAARSTVTVLTTATGVGVPNLEVTFAYPGAQPQVLRTGVDGVATASFPTSGEGPAATDVTIANVPEDRLLVLSPTDGRSSRVVVAAKKTDRALRGVTQVVRNHPTVAVPGGTRTVGQPFGSVASVRGAGAGARTLSATLFGPLTQAPSGCGGPVAAQGTVAVSQDGDYALPAYSASTPGWYVWSLGLAATGTDTAATACGGAVLAKAAPQASVAPSGSYAYPRGSTFPANVSVFGLPPGYQPVDGKAISVFGFGPYYSGGPTPTCPSNEATVYAQVPNLVDGNGSMSGVNSGAMYFGGHPSFDQNFFFTVIFPADRFGRSDEFSTGCLVYDGTRFTNGVTITH